MFEHTGAEHQDAEQADKRITPRRDSSVEKLVAVANIGLVRVPLAYVTSQSVVITLIAVVLVIRRSKQRLVSKVPWLQREDPHRSTAGVFVLQQTRGRMPFEVNRLLTSQASPRGSGRHPVSPNR